MKERPRVLVVEDDNHYQEFLTRTLEHEYQTDVAEDGDRVMACLEHRTYDAILCDLRIPGLSGRDLVHAIRRKTDAETLLIVITGFDQDWSPVDATEAEVYFYLKKGEFSPGELRRVLKNGMDLRRERLERRRYARELERLNRELDKMVQERTHALLESEAKYRNLFQQSLVGIYIQAGGRILLVNDRLCEMLGRTEQDLNDRAVADFLVPIPRRDHPWATSVEGSSETAEEVRLKILDGRDRTALHCAGPIQLEGSGAVQGCVLDITDWKELEQHFLQHQKMESLGTLVSGIAHEFNNILAAMMPQTELLSRRAGEIPSVERPAQILLSMAEKASRLTRQLLNMSRKPTMEKRPIDVNGWIREASNFLATSLESTESLRLDLDPLAGQVEGDPHQLDQLLLNLVLNARDAIAGEGTIRIATAPVPPGSWESLPPGKRESPFVEIKVEDSGCGIPSAQLSRIFDPFFTTKETGRGTGLGLSVAYNLIRQHGGEVFVKSQEGKGSIFSILLPSTQVLKEERPARKSGGKVLVSGTNPGTLDLFKDVLAGMRYEMIPVENQQDAVDVYARQKDKIECVVLDGRFERSTGGSSLGRILDLNPRIKVILACNETAIPLGQWFDSAKEKGARIEQISLPISPEGLSLSLERALCGGSA